MKRIILFLGLAFINLIPLFANEGSGPIPQFCDLGDGPCTRPLNSISFIFKGSIKLCDDAHAVVKSDDGSPVAIASRMEVSNYENIEGYLDIFFDGQLLPKGKEYEITVAPGSIAFEESGITNNEFSQNFFVPENLGVGRVDAEEGIEIANAKKGLPWIYWKIETEPVGQPKYLLYREGILVREIPAYVSWDWNLGQAHPLVEEDMRLEKGVNFSLVFPSGSAHAMYREDIVNEEVIYNFVGGYEEELPALNYVWCNLFSEHPDVINTVSFYYDRPISVSENAKIELWEDKEKVMVKEADATCDQEGNYWVVTADFEGFVPKPMVGYTFVIPEGTIIAENGDPVVNKLCTIGLNDTNGLNNIVKTSDVTTVYDILGRRISNPEPGRIYIKDGKKILLSR